MARDPGSKPHAHLIRIAIFIVILGVGGFLGRMVMVPDSFGKYGNYRAGAVEEELSLPARHQTNDSCLSCHPHIKEMHLTGVHQTVSCEFCHGTLTDHVQDGKWVAALPVKQDQEITRLCLRCHNQIIRARPKESIKMVAMPAHLEEKKVRMDHNCSQCHNVHAPLMWVRMSREIMGLPPDKADPAGEAR